MKFRGCNKNRDFVSLTINHETAARDPERSYKTVVVVVIVTHWKILRSIRTRLLLIEIWIRWKSLWNWLSRNDIGRWKALRHVQCSLLASFITILEAILRQILI